jgi:hypothetical protein
VRIHRLHRRRSFATGVVGLLALALLAAGCSSSPKHGPHPHPVPSITTTQSPATAGQATGLGAKWDWPRLTSYQPYLQQISGSTTFYELVWCNLQQNASAPVDWSSVDQVAQSSQALGIHLMLKIRVGRCWATGGKAQFTRGAGNKTESAMPKSLPAYSDFVTQVVKRYAAMGVKEFAVENEINSQSYWAGTPAQYTTLVTAAAAAIRAADPDAEVVDAGMSSTTYGYGIAKSLLDAGQGPAAIAAYMSYYATRIGTRGNQLPAVTTVQQLQSVLDSAQGQRNLTYLALMSQLAKDKVVDIRQVHFYEPWNNIPALLTYLHANTPSTTPIEAWEVGSFAKANKGTDTTRSQDMVKTLSLLLGGGMRTAIWLPLAVNPAGKNANEPRYGLLNADGSERLAGQMMAAMVAAARGATVEPVSGAGLTGVAFESAGTTDLFTWASGPTVTVKLASGDSSAAVGSALAPLTADGTVNVTSVPMQIHVTGSLSDFLAQQQ